MCGMHQSMAFVSCWDVKHLACVHGDCFWKLAKGIDCISGFRV